MYDVTGDGAAEFHGDPLITVEFVFMGADGKAGYVYALHRATGDLRWKSPADELIAGSAGYANDILHDGKHLYTVGIGDYVVALESRDGTAKWKFSSSAPRDHHRFSNSAVIAAGHVFFAGLDGILYALELNTGKVVWKREFGARFSTAVVADRGHLIVGTASNRLFRVRQSDGSTTALIDLPHPPAYTPVIDGDKVFIVTARELLAVRSSLSQIVWSRKAAKEWSTPRLRLWKGAVVGGDGPDLYALDAESGRELWKQHFGGMIRGVGSDQDVLYVGTLQGDVYAFRPAAHKQAN